MSITAAELVPDDLQDTDPDARLVALPEVKSVAVWTDAATGEKVVSDDADHAPDGYIIAVYETHAGQDPVLLTSLWTGKRNKIRVALGNWYNALWPSKPRGPKPKSE